MLDFSIQVQGRHVIVDVNTAPEMAALFGLPARTRIILSREQARTLGLALASLDELVGVDDGQERQ